MPELRPRLLAVMVLSSTSCRFDLPAPSVPDGPIPEGAHHQYVVSEVRVPTSNPEATEFGLDLDGDRVNDNQLGAVLAALKSQGLDVQGAATAAVDQGSVILLLDLQTTSFSSAGNTDLEVKLGTAPMPAPCTDASDTVCRKHLEGRGSFAVDPSSPAGTVVAGGIVNGTFNGGPGHFSIELPFLVADGVQLDLIGARAKATGMSEIGIESVILAGAVTEADLNFKVLPAIHMQPAPQIDEDCPGPNRIPPGCNCMDGSTGRTIMNLFDTTPKDCAVTVEEIANNTLIKSLLAPDVIIDGQPALSLGIKAQAVKGTIR